MRDGQIWLGLTQQLPHPAIRTQWLHTSIRGKDSPPGARVKHDWYVRSELTPDGIIPRDVGVMRQMQPDGSDKTLCWEISFPCNWFIIGTRQPML